MKLPLAKRCASIPNMKIFHAAAAFLLLSCPAFTQQKPQPQHKPQNQAAAADRLGMTCAQILAMSSTDWIAKAVHAHTSTGDGELRGIRVYGQCYDARTDQLAAALTRKGAEPKKAALANLKDFQAGIEDFTAKTLADIAPPANSVKIAYAGLYKKQFRYEFYQAYEQKTLKPATHSRASSPTPAKDSQARAPEPEPGATSSATPGANPADLPPAPAPQRMPLAGVPEVIPGATVATPTPPTAATPAKAADAVPAPKEFDPFTKAKNHFGELLGMLPEDKIHEVHSAFGKLFGGNPVSEDLKVDVYEYAIFLLERPSDQKFAPPPF